MNVRAWLVSSAIGCVICTLFPVGCKRNTELPSLTLLKDARFGSMWIEAKGEINSFDIAEAEGREILGELASLHPVSVPEHGWNYDLLIVFQSGSDPLRIEVVVLKDRVLAKYGNTCVSGSNARPFKKLLKLARGENNGARSH